MKLQNLLPLLLACLVTACGPSESELRAELSQIDGELMSLRIAAQNHRAQMSQAEIDAFLGSFAVGYGAVSGDYGLAGQGAGTAYNASNQANASSYSLAQIKERASTLMKRRIVILGELE